MLSRRTIIFVVGVTFLTTLQFAPVQALPILECSGGTWCANVTIEKTSDGRGFTGFGDMYTPAYSESPWWGLVEFSVPNARPRGQTSGGLGTFDTYFWSAAPAGHYTIVAIKEANRNTPATSSYARQGRVLVMTGVGEQEGSDETHTVTAVLQFRGSNRADGLIHFEPYDHLDDLLGDQVTSSLSRSLLDSFVK